MDRENIQPLNLTLEIVLKLLSLGDTEAKSKRNAAVLRIIALRLRLPLLARIFRGHWCVPLEARLGGAG